MATTTGGNQPTIPDYPDLPSPGGFTDPGPTGAIDPLWGQSDVPGLMPYMPYHTYDTALDPWHAPYPPGYPQWPTPEGSVNPQPFPNMPFEPVPPGGIPGWNPPFDNIPAIPAQPEPPTKKLDLFKGLFPEAPGTPAMGPDIAMAGERPALFPTSDAHLDAIPANTLDRSMPGWPTNYPPLPGATDRGGPYVPGPGHQGFPQAQPVDHGPAPEGISDEAWRKFNEGDPGQAVDEAEEYLKPEQPKAGRRAGGQMPPALKRNRIRLLNMLRGIPNAPLPRRPAQPAADGVPPLTQMQPLPTSPVAAAHQVLGTPPGFNSLYDLGPFPIRNVGTSMGYA